MLIFQHVIKIINEIFTSPFYSKFLKSCLNCILNSTSQFALATFEVLNRLMWLVAAVLDRAGLQD